MPNTPSAKRAYQLIDPIVAENACELLDVEEVTESGQRILRVYITKDEGVKLEDCEKVSSSIEDLLEVEEIMSGRYNLEVSSPGLNRPLTKPKHFQDSIGQVVKVQTHEPIDGRKNYKGELKEVIQDKELRIFIDNQDFIVPLDKVRKANLVYQS